MNELWVGLDVGSTTVKIAVVHPQTKELLHCDYQRHNADQGAFVEKLLVQAHQKFPENPFRVAFCGSAGEPYAKASGSFFIQEVVANTVAIKELYPQVRVAIELGGQDAKVIFFRQDEKTGKLVASDMRMNGSCAGGTGAFVDQIAELLSVQTEDFNALAAQGRTPYEISGRCGVFAKTDIQPLLNQGVPPADIALSTFHAIAKQTIGGLAQGMEIKPPVIFEGGPLTFNPMLVDVFKERLNLSLDQVVIPQHFLQKSCMEIRRMVTAGSISWGKQFKQLDFLKEKKPMGPKLFFRIQKTGRPLKPGIIKSPGKPRIFLLDQNSGPTWV